MAIKIHPYYFSHTKRFFDIFLAISLLACLSPLLLSISLIVLLTSGQPILFTQLRYGANKKVFNIYKFRTMYKGAERHQSRFEHLNQAPYPLFKVDNDPRFVGVGRLLSKKGLDELPQLLNILKGDMSFVGPRPLPTSQADLLSRAWEFRYKVKPGIFSDWTKVQIRPKSAQRWLELENETLQYGSLYKEIILIIRTLFNLILG